MMVKLAIDKNDKNIITNWGCNYTEMVILTCSFCLFKLGYNHVMWTASFSFNLKEKSLIFFLVLLENNPIYGSL